MKILAVVTLLLLLLLAGFSSASAAATPAKIVTAAVSNAASSLLKRLWSLKYPTKTAISNHRPLMQFESGYTVETVFDGSKLGIEPYSVEVTQSGELLLLDSVSSNLYQISLPLSRYSRAKLIAGSPEGYAGHVDGRPREARLNHPQGFTVDERGNIYVADTMNMAIRKISDTGGTIEPSGCEINCSCKSQMWTWPSGSPCKWVLCCSALSAEEKEALAKFSKVISVPVLNSWNPEVTHVIASTDRNGAYRRTLKILKGILDGKWILTIGWIKACMEAMEPVGEEKFEVTVDIYGISDGPRLGRLRVINKFLVDYMFHICIGVTTIAGGKWRTGGHSDGTSENAKFSTDFEIVYVASSCSLLVVDRGEQAIREIQLNFDDCAHQYETGFPLGIAVLLAAGFFGYMLALLQRRVGVMVSSKDEPQSPAKVSTSPYQKPMNTPSTRPPLIPTGDDEENIDEEGLFSSMGKLITGTWSSIAEIFGSIFPIFRRKQKPIRYQQQQQQRIVNTWATPESFVIPDDEIPPPLETRTPTRRTYAFMSKEPEKIHHIRHPRAYANGWNAEPHQQVHQQHHLKQYRQYSSGPQTFYEQSCATTNEIVFGAVQELDSRRRSVEIKAVNYGDPIYEQYGVRLRNSSMGYGNY